MMEHLQYGVLLNENVTLDALRQFPVVCLPNVGILSAREVKLLRDYVDDGGKLLVTGHTGQFNARGMPLDQPHLAELIGARVKRRLASDDNWVSLDSPDLSTDLRQNWPFLVKGPATVYEATTATPYGKLFKPHRTRRQVEGKMHTDWPMSPDVPVGPAVLVNQSGDGTVLTCAGSPDYATASEHAIVEDRTLFRNAFRTLLPRRRVEIDAPANVEAVVTEDRENRTLRVHFVAYNPTPRTTPQTNRPFVLPGLIEDRPIYRVSFVVNDGFRSVEAHNQNTEVQIDGETVRAVIEDIHDVLVVEY
jgi:hypothetical protein